MVNVLDDDRSHRPWKKQRHIFCASDYH